MKVAVIGSRSFEVDDLGKYLPEETTEIISGGARGVDYEKRKVMRSEVLDAAQENSRERNHFA